MTLKKEPLSIVITIILIGSITALVATNVIRFSDISSAVAYVLVAGIIGVLVWGFKGKINPKLRIEKDEDETQYEEESVESDDEKEEEKIARKTIKLRLEEFEEIKLYLRRDEKLRGEISSDGFFDFFIMTESSFKSFKKDNTFHYLDGGEAVSHFEVDCEIPRRGIYFIVIENTDDKNIVVNVNLLVER